MSVKFEILESGWVACYSFDDPWTTAEFTAHYPQDSAYRTSVNHPVHWLLDFQSSRQLPPSDIFRARSGAPALLYPHSGEMIFVGTNTLEKRIAETILKIIRYKNARFLDTGEEAWRYLRRRIAEDQKVVPVAFQQPVAR